MNSFKMLIALFSLVVTAQTAFAGEADCEPLTTKLTCEANYELESSYGPGVIEPGPVKTVGVENYEMEPFDPAICVNTLSLLTYAGHFIVTYFHTQHTFAAHLYSDGRPTTLSDYATIDPRTPMTFTVKSPFKGIVSKIHFKCTLKD